MKNFNVTKKRTSGYGEHVRKRVDNGSGIDEGVVRRYTTPRKIIVFTLSVKVRLGT